MDASTLLCAYMYSDLRMLLFSAFSLSLSHFSFDSDLKMLMSESSCFKLLISEFFPVEASTVPLRSTSLSRVLFSLDSGLMLMLLTFD